MRKFFAVALACLLATTFSAQNHMINNELSRLLRHPELAPRQVSVFIKGNIPLIQQLTREQGGFFKYAAGDIASVRIPVEGLARFIGQRGIERIEYYPEPGVLLNDHMIVNNHVQEVHDGLGDLPQGYDGEGVIIGFLDTGIDITHPDFQNPDGTTRIRYIWDQFYPLAPNTPPQYGYGQEWDWNDINAGQCPHLDPWWHNGHGSNVAGVAASDGSAVNNYKGVAPKADIIMVAINEQEDFLMHVADGIDYIFKKANILGKPCVINTSVGTYFGSHDGRDLTSQIIDNLLEEKSGRAVVAAAGNAGKIPFHVGYTATQDTSFTWFKYNPDLSAVYFQVWSEEGQLENIHFSIGVDDPADFKHRGETRFYNILADLNMQDTTAAWFRDSIYFYQHRLGIIEVYIEKSFGRYGMDVIIYPDSLNYYWSFRTTGSGRIDIWSARYVTGTSDMVLAGLPSSSVYPDIVYYRFPDFKQTIVSSWQCSDHVLTMGNYVNRNHYIDYNGNLQTVNGTAGDLAGSSSHGPTRDQRIKPDATASASGTLTTGALNYMNILIQVNPALVAPGGMHRINGGTSMASPVGAGIAALYFQRYPQATYREVIEAIRSTTYTDGFTGQNLPNNAWGYGKVSAYSALTVRRGCTDPAASNYDPQAQVDDSSCVYLTGIPGHDNPESLRLYPSPAGEYTILHISGYQPGQTIRLLTPQGQVVMNLPATGGEQFLSLKDLPAGLYFVTLQSSHEITGMQKLIHY